MLICFLLIVYKIWIRKAFSRQLKDVAIRKGEGVPRGVHWERNKKITEFKEFAKYLQVIYFDLVKYLLCS